jgi:hypothetical protein
MKAKYARASPAIGRRYLEREPIEATPSDAPETTEVTAPIGLTNAPRP